MNDRVISLETALQILVPHDWPTDKRGEFLEKFAAQILRKQSYEIDERVSFTGMEIDLLGQHKPSKERIYVECKFLSSAIGANVIDLMIGQSFRRRIRQLALFSAGALSKGAKGAIDELKDDERVNFSYYGPDAILETLIDTDQAPSLNEISPNTSISHATLLIHPNNPCIWLLQEQIDGSPHRIIPYTNATHRPSIANLRALLDTYEILEGLPVVDYYEPLEKNERVIANEHSSKEPSEVVAQVITADTILDPRPCRPEDFVGRVQDQQDIWNFLADVRNGTTNTRLLALVGASGYGKSSLISKLAERFRNKKWRGKYFLYPVDVRSARGPLFVGEAFLSAIRQAIHAGFIGPVMDLGITDAAHILDSSSIQSVQEMLAAQNKVLVIFFDQFEEVFTKDELLSVFRVFKRFALDIHSAQSNFVIGFSWRTGISFSDENPAYQLWNELRDHRLTKTIERFNISESANLIAQFESDLGIKLLPPLRRRLQEQGQGLPWFLKKLCIHVHKQIKEGVSQSDLLSRRLNVQALFDEDLEHLTSGQLSCLKYISENSPADSLEVSELYGNEVISSLTSRRLIIRAGQRLAVYWDVFRDFLNEGKIPAIPWTYIPNGTLNMALAACEQLERHNSLQLPNLAKLLGYSEKTTTNIVTDLQNCALCGRDNSGYFSLLDGVDHSTMPDRIRSQFIGHVLYQRTLALADEPGFIKRDQIIGIIRDLYASADIKSTTKDNYLARILPWLEYSGLVESYGSNISLFSGTRKSKNFGISVSSGKKGQVFLATAPPELAATLLTKLINGGPLSREAIFTSGQRNASQDLVFLGIARWEKGTLAATLAYSDPEEAFRKAIRSTPVFDVLNPILRSHPNATRGEIGLLLASELNRNWKASSALRFSNGLCRYLEYLSLGDLGRLL